MSLTKVLFTSFILACVLVAGDVLRMNYLDFRAHIQAQTIVVKTAVEQINEIANSTFAKSIAQAYYRQAQMDMFVLQTFGSQVANTFKQQEAFFVRECAPTFGELKCRTEWYDAQAEEIRRMFEKRSEDIKTFPV